MPAAPRLPRLVVVPVAPAHPSRARRVWGETWRVLVALLTGLTVMVLVAWEVDTGQRVMTGEQWALDFVVGLVGLGLLLLRRRAPLTIALVLCAGAAVSSLVVGAETIAVISLATTRRWWKVAVVGVVFVAAGRVHSSLHPYVAPESYDRWIELVGGAVMYTLFVWIGAYIGLRREHLASLRERAETAEREQASRVAQARTAERARIAREMHDVLAHRISLVAMHAGALAYRTDLPPAKVAETAAVVQENAHAALAELREVLGVLRETGVEPAEPGGRVPEPPQPSLTDLDELLVEARASGVDPATRMVELARARAVGADVRLGEAEHLPFDDGAFDAVLAVNAFQFAADPDDALAEIARVLTPDGVVGLAGWADRTRNDLDAINVALAEADDEEPPEDGPLRLPGGLAAVLADAGWAVLDHGVVPVPWTARDANDLVRGILFGEGDATVAELAPVVVEAAAPFRRPDGSYHLLNAFRWAVARRP